MDTALKMDKIEGMDPVWRGGSVREISEDYVVPDSMPDVGEVADAQGILTVQGKDADSGGVQLSASLSVCVLYSPESGGGLRSIELTLPADLRMEAPGTDMDCRVVARVRVRSLEARTVNSRKLAIRAELEAEACCYRSAVTEIASDLKDPAGVQLLRQEAEALIVSDVREKTFAMTDDYVFPAGCGADAHLLTRRTEICPEDVQYVGGKALFRGRVRSVLAFASAENGQIFSERYETEYSQIMEITAAGDDARPEMTLFLTGAYFDLPEYGQEGDRIRAEFHLAAQCVCRECRSIPYIADLYSNRTELVPETECRSFVGGVRPVMMRQTVAERVESVPSDGQLLFSSASVGSVVAEENAVRTAVFVRLVYGLPGGGTAVSRSRFSAEFTLPDLDAEETLRDISVTVADVYCVPGTGDVRLSLRLDAFAERPASITCVCAVAETEPEADRRSSPSAVLLWTKPGADLWALARTYHSTVEDILAVNEGRREGLLLVPKGR